MKQDARLDRGGNSNNCEYSVVQRVASHNTKTLATSHTQSLIFSPKPLLCVTQAGMRRTDFLSNPKPAE